MKIIPILSLEEFILALFSQNGLFEENLYSLFFVRRESGITGVFFKIIF